MINTYRTAGICLAIAMLLWIAMIAAWPFLVGSTPIADAEHGFVVLDRANHMLAREAGFRLIWFIEAVGSILLAVAAFTLATRDSPSGRVGWIAVGVGATVYIVMYAVMMGSYWPAARAAADDPALLEAMIAVAFGLFYLSNICFNTGFAFAFWREAKLPNGVLPKWAAWIGVILSLLGALASLAGLSASPSISALISIDPFAAIAAAHFALIAWLGLGIFKKS